MLILMFLIQHCYSLERIPYHVALKSNRVLTETVVDSHKSIFQICKIDPIKTKTNLDLSREMNSVGFACDDISSTPVETKNEQHKQDFRNILWEELHLRFASRLSDKKKSVVLITTAFSAIALATSAYGMLRGAGFPFSATFFGMSAILGFTSYELNQYLNQKLKSSEFDSIRPDDALHLFSESIAVAVEKAAQRNR